MLFNLFVILTILFGIITIVLSIRLIMLKPQMTQLQLENQALTALRDQQSDIQREFDVLIATNKRDEIYTNEIRTELKEKQHQYDQLLDKYNQLHNSYTITKTRFDEKEEHFSEQIALLKDQRELMQKEFKVLAGEIFEEKGKSFRESSQVNLASFLKPFREQIDGFRTKVEEIHREETKQKSELRQSLTDLSKLNEQITQEAQNLTEALQGNKKMQGNWGEIILESILERSGLQHHINYETQKSVFSDEGQRQIPDVIINLPKNRHIIVDSKVSLNAYLHATNAESEEEMFHYLDSHIDAIRRHIKELSERHYTNAKGINSPEVVVMFMPIESAFIEAFRTDDSLFQYANDMKILVTTPTTLLTSLNIIYQLWRLEDQSQNTEALANLASSVYDKIRTFLSSMDGIERGLERAQESYQIARNQLISGRGNLIKLSDDFLELGVAVKAEINQEWRNEASLELTRNYDLGSDEESIIVDFSDTPPFSHRDDDLDN